MSKFCGVISASPNRFEHFVLEFVDLELIGNFLINETENLAEEFQRKVQFVQEQQIQVLNNEKNLEDIHKDVQPILCNMSEIEGVVCDISGRLHRMERVILQIEKCSFGFCHRKTTSEYEMLLKQLLQMEPQVNCIGQMVQEVAECEQTTVHQCKLGDIKYTLTQFLDSYAQILEQSERNLDRMQDKLNTIAEAFQYMQQKLCIWKPTSDM